MNTIKSIWENTFLAKTLREDRRFGIGIVAVLCIYAIVHIAKLEVFPFYMFAMYSQSEEPKELYTSYQLTCNGLLALDEAGTRRDFAKKNDYRSYTYVLNTITQYGEILENNLVHPESKVYDKFMDRLHLSGSSIDRSMKQPYIYEKSELDRNLHRWLCQYFDIDDAPFQIEKTTTKWDSPHPPIIIETKIYELAR